MSLYPQFSTKPDIIALWLTYNSCTFCFASETLLENITSFLPSMLSVVSHSQPLISFPLQANDTQQSSPLNGPLHYLIYGLEWENRVAQLCMLLRISFGASYSSQTVCSFGPLNSPAPLIFMPIDPQISDLSIFSPKPELWWGEVSAYMLILYSWRSSISWGDVFLVGGMTQWGSSTAFNQKAY